MMAERVGEPANQDRPLKPPCPPHILPLLGCRTADAFIAEGRKLRWADFQIIWAAGAIPGDADTARRFQDTVLTILTRSVMAGGDQRIAELQAEIEGDGPPGR